MYKALRIAVLFAAALCLAACKEKESPEQHPDFVNDAVISVSAADQTETPKVKVTEAKPIQKEDHLAYLIEGDKATAKSVQPGTVLVTDDNIVLVTSVTKQSSSSIIAEGPKGDLSYVFHDTNFRLHLAGTEEPQTNEATGDYFPVSTKAAYDAVLWDKEKEWDWGSEWKKEKGETKQYADYKIHTVVGTSLSAAIDFNFSESVADVFEGVEFIRSGNYDVTVTLTGEVHSSADLTVDYKIDKDFKFLLSHYNDPTILLKHDFLEPKIFFFFVGKVPFIIHIGCDLYAQIDFTAHGEMTFSMGAEAGAKGTIGYKYDGATGEKKKVNPGLVPYMERHDPTIKGKGVISPKVSVWPHEYLWISYVTGVYADIRPYGRADFGVGFSEDLIEDSTDDYLTNTTDVYVGADWSVGISTPLDVLAPGISYEKDWLEMGKGNIFEKQVVKSPARLVLKEASSSVFAPGNTYDLTFLVQAEYYGVLAKSVFLPIVKIDIPSRTYNTYRFCNILTGETTYQWAPEKRGEELIASVYDIDGKVVGQLTFQAGIGETTLWLKTGMAQDVTSSSASIPVEFECPGEPEDFGVVYSSVNTNPEVLADGCTAASIIPYGPKVIVPVSGLKENTMYCVRAFLKYENQYYYGDPVSFKTGLSSYGVGNVPGENL